jgi:hypothetical protein
MPLTRANVELFLVGRCRGLMTLAAFALTTAGQSTPNADLSDPISEALQACGITPLSIVLPVDSDLAQLPDASARKLFDYAELRLKQNLLGSLQAKPTQQAGLNRRDFSDTMKELRADIARLEALVIARYGAGLDYIQVAQMVPPDPPLPIWPWGMP